MSYDTISFSPKITNSLFSDRFNHIDKIFSTLTGEKPISELPEYNLIKFDNNQYKLILSATGYKRNELNITIENNQLNISGKKNKNTLNHKEKNTKYIHLGIKNNQFSIHFNLNNPIKIKSAKLKLGLLIIKFEFEIPESQKIKKIDIQK